jgi:hypothetical protein
MSNTVALKPEFDVSRLVIHGDLSQLSPAEKSQYYILRCKEHGLNPSSKPFDFIRFQGKEVLYANKGCAEQLRSINKVSIKVTKAEQVGDLFVVTVEAKDGQGREDGATGAVSIVGLKGEALANAMMKAETKAKRRVTLSICGLNMLDESEVNSIEGATRVAPEQPGVLDGTPHDEGYKINFGQWNRRSLEQVYRDEGGPAIAKYIEYLEDTAAKKNQTIDPNGKVGIFIREAESFLAAMENGVTS